MNDSKFKIGKKLKSARVSCGYTQEAVAEILRMFSKIFGSIRNK